jgi:hypothetical protein
MMISVAVSGSSSSLLVARVPPGEVVELLEDALLVVVRRVADEAAGVQAAR